MRNLLIVGVPGVSAARIKDKLEKSFVIAEAEHLQTVSFLNEVFGAVLLLIDENTEQYLNELQEYTLDFSSALPPVILATNNPDAQYVRQAIRRGAVDYIDLNVHSFTIENRIVNIMTRMNPRQVHADSMNHLLFYRCIGPAMMLEVSEDESVLHAVMVNNEYYDTIGLPRNFYEGHANLLETSVPEELESTRKAVHEAIVRGTSECMFTNPATNGQFKGIYRLASRTDRYSMILVTIQDVTAHQMRKNTDENLMRLPGMILFTYEPKDDTITFQITTKKNKKVTKVNDHLMEADKQKLIAPETYHLFKRNIQNAMKEKITGNMDLRMLFDGRLTWYRMYYRSITNPSGAIYRIVGRLDDPENDDFIQVEGIEKGLCDMETHLPTYGTAFQFIRQVLHEHKQGTLMLIGITGLDEASKEMETVEYQAFLQSLVHIINNQFISTDLIGRFDTECFIAFMPQTTSRNLAPKKAAALIKAVQEVLPHDKFSVNIGVCIIRPEHSSLETIISESSIALWQAQEEGKGTYRLFENDQDDLNS